MQFTFDFLYLLALSLRILEFLARKSSEDKVPPETIFFVCARSRRLITFLHIQLLCNEQRLNFYYFSLRMLSTKNEAFIAKVSICFYSYPEEDQFEQKLYLKLILIYIFSNWVYF